MVAPPINLSAKHASWTSGELDFAPYEWLCVAPRRVARRGTRGPADLSAHSKETRRKRAVLGSLSLFQKKSEKVLVPWSCEVLEAISRDYSH